ncbi:hypothetical protein NPIL_246101 [Nephila pilipes]|uniref:Uncharacterized protein n=1 Tax=Nephila pilipes TaxID=299642 RepID=A0A8X6J7V8_NEPPI|nr:hypothetical protein NPIL_246101 [Nephila pilipes]
MRCQQLIFMTHPTPVLVGNGILNRTNRCLRSLTFGAVPHEQLLVSKSRFCSRRPSRHNLYARKKLEKLLETVPTIVRDHSRSPLAKFRGKNRDGGKPFTYC